MNREENISEGKQLLEEILEQRDRLLHDTGIYPPYIGMSRNSFYKIMPIARDEGLLEIDKVTKMYRLAAMTVVFEDVLPCIPNRIIKKRGRTDE